MAGLPFFISKNKIEVVFDLVHGDVLSFIYLLIFYMFGNVDVR